MGEDSVAGSSVYWAAEVVGVLGDSQGAASFVASVELLDGDDLSRD